MDNSIHSPGRDPDRVYAGILHARGPWQVMLTEYGHRRNLKMRLDVFNHSPTGLSWGYGGSGPAQTALAILVDAIGAERAIALHQDFKWQVIAKLSQDKDWTMTHEQVMAWVWTARPQALSEPERHAVMQWLAKPA